MVIDGQTLTIAVAGGVPFLGEFDQVLASDSIAQGVWALVRAIVASFARRLKTLNGLKPDEYIRNIWTSEPNRLTLNPIHKMPGLNTYAR